MRREVAVEARLLQALDQLGRVDAGTDAGTIGERAARAIQESLGLDFVAVALVDETDGVAVHFCHASDLDVPRVPGYRQPLSHGAIGLAARERRTVYVPDVHAEPCCVDIVPGILTELAVPVAPQGRVIAVIDCGSRDPEVLRDRGVLLEVVASRLGVTLENARLLHERDAATERAVRHARELEALNEVARIVTGGLELSPMLQRITDTLARCFDWEFVACMSVDPVKRRFRCEALTTEIPTGVYVGYGRALGSGVVGEVAATGNPILLDDVRLQENYVETLPGAMSELCVPVKYGGELVAIINLESTRLAAFRNDLRLLETISEQVAGAIAAARAYEALARRAAQLETIGEVSRSVMGTADLSTVLDRVVTYLHALMGLPVVAILLYDGKGRMLTLVAHAGNLPMKFQKGASWPVDSGVVGRAARSGSHVLVADVRADPAYIATNEDIVSELAIPIRFQGETLGVLNLESTSADAFSPEAVAVLQTLTDQISGAIHTAAVNGKLSEANRTLKELFSRYVAPDVVEALAREPGSVEGRADRRDVSVLFADIRGFTRIAQRLDSQAVLDLLNGYYRALGDAIFAERGSINRFLGDGLLAVFGAPERLVRHQEAALKAALSIQEKVKELSGHWLEVTGEPLQVVVAINSGPGIVGSIGDPRHMEFTVLGDVVNVASRLEAEAKARDALIVAAGSVVEAMPDLRATPLGETVLRGREGAVAIYRIL
ncbi:MAG: GAF domain-containing protein [Acidobacteriota bacterium]